MAYTPVNWQTGDTITAERLNRMDRGWGYESTEILSETVTTEDTYGEGYGVGSLSYSQLINSPTIVVTFDGVGYTCPNTTAGEAAENNSSYGAPYLEQGGYDFSDYPFAIESYSGPFGIGNDIFTKTIGSHTFTVAGSVIVTSSDFNTAVAGVAQPIVADAVAAIPTPYLVTINTTTWAEVNSALKAGRPALVWNHTDVNNQPDTYEFVTDAWQNTLTVHTLAVNSDAVVVNTYKAASASSALTKVTS